MESSYDLTAYAGQAVQIYFGAFNDEDGSGVTGFYLDDVAVQVCPGPASSAGSSYRDAP